jgi:hypothetical protein
VAAVNPSRSNLVIAEIMYNPPAQTAAESAVQDKDDFEYIRLLNVSGNAVKLSEVRFDNGIGFDFANGSIPVIDAGQSVLIVSNLVAFRLRYGNGYDALIAGEFTGTSLSNSGERLRLRTGSSTTLHEFIYESVAPWPTAADGQGPSLLLKQPLFSPDHADPENWIASAHPGGRLVAPSMLNYERWRSLFWDSVDASQAKSSSQVDFDQDELSNFAEYALGYNPLTKDGPHFSTSLGSVNDQEVIVLEYRTLPGATDAATSGQFSTELTNWQATVPLGQPFQNDDGSQTHRTYAPMPPGTTWQRLFLRVRVQTD